MTQNKNYGESIKSGDHHLRLKGYNHLATVESNHIVNYRWPLSRLYLVTHNRRLASTLVPTICQRQTATTPVI